MTHICNFCISALFIQFLLHFDVGEELLALLNHSFAFFANLSEFPTS